MSGRGVTSEAGESSSLAAIPFAALFGFLEAVDGPAFLTDRNGQIVAANILAKPLVNLAFPEQTKHTQSNLLEELLGRDAHTAVAELGDGTTPVEREMEFEGIRKMVRLRAIPDSDWVLVQIAEKSSPASASTQLTVQELLQEREITYRNLLAAYLKLQEVNRQKTVFLASAAHELKTPLAVIKGYYDLLLTNSLGKLTDKQKDILEESKESCERLVRLVSMFLNYSALESGKLVLQLRENDLRDCLDEVAKRWSEAFQRKGVRLDASFDPSIA